jgi:hypothetical protein
MIRRLRQGPRRPFGAALLAMIWLVPALAAGCMKEQLRQTAARTTSTVSDLQYQQVMDNLARIASNPGYLPYLAIAGQGSVQVTDSGASGLNLDTKAGLLTVGSFSVGGARDVTGTWNLGTITSPEKLHQMQVLYLNVLRGTARGEPRFSWLQIGCRRAVPRRACYVGRHGSVYVWVEAEGIAGLSELTLAILDVATREDLVAQAPPDRSRGLAGSPVVPRRNFQAPPVGPVFTPSAR